MPKCRVFERTFDDCLIISFNDRTSRVFGSTLSSPVSFEHVLIYSGLTHTWNVKNIKKVFRCAFSFNRQLTIVRKGELFLIICRSKQILLIYQASFYFIFLFGPSFSNILASIASFVILGSASWIRGSDPAILNLCARKLTGYLCKFFGLIILYVELSLFSVYLWHLLR